MSRSPSPKLTVVTSRFETIREALLGKSSSSSFIKRPRTTRFQDNYNILKIPKNIQKDKEKLYEENINLKVVSNELTEEIIKLKTKVKTLEDIAKKSEQTESRSQLASLKQNLSEARQKLLEKDFELIELKKKKKVTRINELEKEIKTYSEECIRLAFYLNEFMKKNNISKATLDYEKEIYNRNVLINTLRKNNKDKELELRRFKEETFSLREKGMTSSKFFKRTSKLSEISVGCSECEKLQRALEANTQEFELLKLQQFHENERANTITQDLQSKIDDYTKKHNEHTAIIESLTKQLTEARVTVIEAHRNSISLTSSTQFIKKRHPPKLFLRISKILKQKYMFLSVFLSLLDKKNNGYIEVEDLMKGLKYQEKLMERKHLDEVLNLMNWTARAVPLKLIEEWYEKFYYDSDESGEESESENNLMSQEKVSAVMKNESALAIASVSESIAVTEVKSTFQEVDLQEALRILEKIKMFMLEQNIQRSKVMSFIFKDPLINEAYIDPHSLINFFSENLIEAASNTELFQLSVFLIQPEGSFLLSSDQLQSYRAGFNEVTRKLQKYLPEWKLIDRNRAHSEISKRILYNKEYIQSALGSDLVPIKDFFGLIENLGFCTEESLTYLYLLSFIRTREVLKVSVNAVLKGIEIVEDEISKLKLKNREILSLIREKMKGIIETLDNSIGFETEFCIGIDQFKGSFSALGVELTEDFLKDLTGGKPMIDLNYFRALLNEDLNASSESERFYL